jgi:hypothetical protein
MTTIITMLQVGLDPHETVYEHLENLDVTALAATAQLEHAPAAIKAKAKVAEKAARAVAVGVMRPAAAAKPAKKKKKQAGGWGRRGWGGRHW